MRNEIAINNSLARDHAERIRLKAAELSMDKVGKSTHSGYTALSEAETCFEMLTKIVSDISTKLEEDCHNLAATADIWKKEDKYIATYMTVTFEKRQSAVL